VAWQEPPWYGTVCQVVWEDGGGNPASYPILSRGGWKSLVLRLVPPTIGCKILSLLPP
jgi:hypothetical protein